MKRSAHHPRKWLPHPRFSLFLLVLWLLMVESFAVAQILLGGLLAWLIPFGTQQFWLEQSSMHHPVRMVQYVFHLFVDIIRSNFMVAWQIISPQNKLKPGFVEYPIQLQNDFAITLLASTVTLTPGTVSAHITRDKKVLLLHVLHLTDEQALVEAIHLRYETLLQEIFEC